MAFILVGVDWIGKESIDVEVVVCCPEIAPNCVFNRVDPVMKIVETVWRHI